MKKNNKFESQFTQKKKSLYPMHTQDSHLEQQSRNSRLDAQKISSLGVQEINTDYQPSPIQNRQGVIQTNNFSFNQGKP